MEAQCAVILERGDYLASVVDEAYLTVFHHPRKTLGEVPGVVILGGDHHFTRPVYKARARWKAAGIFIQVQS